MSICRVPGCGKTLYPLNRTGVCRGHNHSQPHCHCYQCVNQGAKRKWRMKTRAEMQAESLLPSKPTGGGA